MNSRCEALEVFQDVVEKGLVELAGSSTQPFKKNLTRAEMSAMKKIKSNTDIIVKNADKGGMVVVLNREDYKQEALRQLSDTQTYVKLKEDPTRRFGELLFKLIDEGVYLGVLSLRVSNYLEVQEPLTPIFHHLPKIHKKDRPPKGRPIVAGIGSLNERFGQWVDFHLRPLVDHLPSLLVDSKHVLKVMDGIAWPEKSPLVRHGRHCPVFLDPPFFGYPVIRVLS